MPKSPRVIRTSARATGQVTAVHALASQACGPRSLLTLFVLSGVASLLGTGCLGTEYDSEGKSDNTGAAGRQNTDPITPLPTSGGAAAVGGTTLEVSGGRTAFVSTESYTSGGTSAVSLGGAVSTDPASSGGSTVLVASSSPISTGGTAAGGSQSIASAGASGDVSAAQCANPALIGPALRPQLRPATAENYTTAKYLAQSGTLGALVRDDWDPTAGLGDIGAFSPSYTVDVNGTGTHTTLQAAVDAAVAAGETSRAYIRVLPGAYEEVVCVDAPRPITIYGAGADPSDVVITSSNNAGKARDDLHNRCVSLEATATTYGIQGSATFMAKSNEVQLKNLTISNEFVEDANVWTAGSQGVALYTYGDRIVAENVRVTGNHYVLALDTPDPSVVSRVYIKDSQITGDMQYIVGRGTAVIDKSEVHFITTRLTSPMGSIMAASTAGPNSYGFLIVNSRLTVIPDSGFSWVLLGRSWDVNTQAAEWTLGTSPNGHILIRDSFIDSHIKATQPWGNALETARLYDCFESRLYEYNNTGPGALVL